MENEKKTDEVKNNLGNFSLIDFSEIKEPGIYKIKYNKKGSEVNRSCKFFELNFQNLLNCFTYWV